MTQFDYSKQDILDYDRAEESYLERNPEYRELLNDYNFFQVEQQDESFKARGLILMNGGTPEVKPPYKARHINLDSLEDFMLNERLQFTEKEFFSVHKKFQEFFDEYSYISLSDLINASYVVYTKKRKERTYTEQMQVICNTHLPIEVENEMEYYFQRKFVNLKTQLLYFGTWEESRASRGNGNGTYPQNLWKNYKNEIASDAKLLTRPEGIDTSVLEAEDFERIEIYSLENKNIVDVALERSQKLEKTEPHTIPTEERENNNHMREMADDLTPKKIEDLTKRSANRGERKTVLMSMDDPRYLEVLKSIKIKRKTKKRTSPRKSRNDGIYNLKPKQVIGYPCVNKVRIGLSVPENGKKSKVIKIDAYNHKLSGYRFCMEKDNIVKRIRFAKENNKGTWKLLDKDKRTSGNGKASKDFTITCYQGKCWIARKV